MTPLSTMVPWGSFPVQRNGEVGAGLASSQRGSGRVVENKARNSFFFFFSFVTLLFSREYKPTLGPRLVTVLVPDTQGIG